MQGLKILVTISVEVRIVNPFFFVVNANTFGHCVMFSGKITTPPSPNVPVHLCTSPKRGFTPTKPSNALLLLVVNCIKWNLTINCCGARHLIPLHHPQWKRSLYYQWLFYCQFPEVSIWIMHGWKVEIIKNNFHVNYHMPLG